MTGYVAAGLALGAVYFCSLLPTYARMNRAANRARAGRVKMSMSGSFVALGLLGVIAHRFDPLYAVIAAGLVFGAIGDYFLLFMLSDRRKFRIGVFFFGLNQIVYIGAMIAAMRGFGAAEFILFAVFAAAAAGVIAKRRPDFGPEKAQLATYLALVTYMGAKAASLPLWNAGARWILFGAGGLLFYLSDMVLAYWKYIRRKKYLHGLNSCLYFTGQFLIAFSLLV